MRCSYSSYEAYQLFLVLAAAMVFVCRRLIGKEPSPLAWAQGVHQTTTTQLPLPLLSSIDNGNWVGALALALGWSWRVSMGGAHQRRGV